MKKDSAKTKNRILQAVGRLLATQGFQGIGVNAVAREAGVDKVLIYRYFGTFQKLLHAFAMQEEFWPKIDQLLGADLDAIVEMDSNRLLTTIFTSHLKELLKRPTTMEIMRWELIQRNELTDELCEAREAQGEDLFKLMPEDLKHVTGVDVPAVLALIHGGISYLALRSKTADTYAGVDLHSEEGWQRIENGIKTLVTAFTEYCLNRKEAPE